MMFDPSEGLDNETKARLLMSTAEQMVRRTRIRAKAYDLVDKLLDANLVESVDRRIHAIAAFLEATRDR